MKLLNEMLNHFSEEVSTDGDKEIIRVGLQIDLFHFICISYYLLTKQKCNCLKMRRLTDRYCSEI